jgi:hypothetical protein
MKTGGCVLVRPAASHPRKGKPVAMPGRKAIGPIVVQTASGSLAAEGVDYGFGFPDS